MKRRMMIQGRGEGGPQMVAEQAKGAPGAAAAGAGAAGAAGAVAGAAWTEQVQHFVAVVA